jgi:MFS family permease
MAEATTFLTNVPTRLDRLPWSRFHWLVVMALGITWILDGLEVTLVGSLSAVIARPEGLNLSESEVGLTASAYIAGAVLGALFFGYLTDRLGRKRLFTITVAVYLVATVLTGFSWDFWSFVAFRFVTGAGIGGEYAAINSAIQELIPARHRGATDLIINGSFWVGGALGALGAIVVLNPDIIAAWLGWRFAFVLGGVIGIIIIYLRRFIPESPRWLMTHGYPQEAERIVADIEAGAAREHGIDLSRTDDLPKIQIKGRRSTPILEVVRVLFATYPRRTLVGLALMTSQAFCYNAIFFTYALILTKFYAIDPTSVGWFIFPFAAGNFLGPLLLGRLFDTIGRRVMIAGTYGLAGGLLTLTGYLFNLGVLTAETQTAAWMVVFFFASAAASAAYLTVGETFPLEMRAMSIAVFYALGTALGGSVGPALFGILIQSGERSAIMWGYVLGGGLMMLAAVVQAIWGTRAARLPLEDVATPLSHVPP